jgi:hypothetical protein
MKRIVIVCLFTLWPAVSLAQSLSPLYVEASAKKELRASFTIGNTGVQPLIATVQAREFEWHHDGTYDVKPVNPADVTLKLSQVSARIGALQHNTFYYDAVCHLERCSLMFLTATSHAGRIDKGFKTVIILPTTVYMCSDGAKNCRLKIRSAAGLKS